MQKKQPIIREYIVTINKDRTETKELLKETFSESVPSKEELYKDYIKVKRITLLLYVIIMAIFMYLCFKF